MENKQGNREEKGGKNPQDQDKGRPGEKGNRDDQKGGQRSGGQQGRET